MFEKIFEFITSIIELFFLTRIVEEWESGVVLRFGQYQRAAKPGMVWVWPLAIERVVTIDTYPRTTTLPAQSLTTADGSSVVVSCVVTHQVTNARKALLDCGNAEEVLLEALTGVIAEHVTGACWKDLTTSEFWCTVTTDAGARAKKWGLKITAVQPRDITRCRSLRLFGSAPSSPQH